MAYYLLEYLIEAGCCSFDAGLAKPLNWQELKAWADLTLVSLNADEMLALRKLSISYSAYFNQYNGVDSSEPTLDEEVIKNRVADKLEAAFKLLESVNE